MYTYYVPIQLEDHLLYSSEIASKYRIKSDKNGTPHAQLISMVINDYLAQYEVNAGDIYYQTSHGLAKVYPKEIYEPAMGQFLKKYTQYNVTYQYLSLGNAKTYRFKIEE